MNPKRTVIEAAASKLPVISTPVGSIPDFLNSENATVCDLEAFSENMIKTMSNYELALEKTERLFDDIKAIFDIESVYKKHLNLYQSIV